MASNYNPSIVTSGLVLALDAANTKSYPGSGTAWTDLSGNGYTGTLTNGPTYSSSNGGYFAFVGASNQHAAVANTTVLQFTGSITLQAIIYPTSYIPSNGSFLIAMAGAYYLELKSSGVLRSYFYGLNTEGYHDGTNTIP